MTTPSTHPLSGGCLCGAVRYTCQAAPVYSVNCHCRDCQKTTGSGYAPIFMLPLAAVTVTGQVTYYASAGDSGHSVKRGFCPTCGSQLFGQPAVMPGMVGIKAASLDEPAHYQPLADMYADSAQIWDVMHPDLPKFPKAHRAEAILAHDAKNSIHRCNHSPSDSTQQLDRRGQR